MTFSPSSEEVDKASAARRRRLNFASVVQNGCTVGVMRIPVMVWLLQPVSFPVMAAPRRARTSASQIVSLPRFLETSAAAAAFSAR